MALSLDHGESTERLNPKWRAASVYQRSVRDVNHGILRLTVSRRTILTEKAATSPAGQTLTKMPTAVGGDSGDRAHIRRMVVTSVLLFLVSFMVLFLGMRRYPLPYDEGVVLTAAMRIAAGQVPHRDFYEIYGPADFYLPAALFKLFGPSLLVVRFLDLFVEGITVVTMFVVASFYSRRPVAICVTLVTFLWIYGLNAYISSTVFPVALLSLVSSILLIPLFAGGMTRTRLCAAGAIAGLCALYRYDTGVALLAIQVCVIVIVAYFRPNAASGRLSITLSALWPYILGFAILTGPAIIYFLSVSSIYPLIYDVVVLQAANYQRYRHMPFPGIHLKKLDDLAVYGPIVTIALSLFVLLTFGSRSQPDHPADKQERSGKEQLRGLLIILSVLTFVMFFKGYVRVGTLNMFISFLPSLLLTAVLFEYRMRLPRLPRTLVSCLACFFIFTAAFCAAKATRFDLLQGSIPDRIARVLFASGRPAPQPGPAWCKLSNPLIKGFCFLEDDGLTSPSPEAQSAWCEMSNPLTNGFCFLVDYGRMQTIEFIETHTRPDQRLFVGLSRHDRTIGNDNLIYFATQRLPATKWSHFDPGLQNSYPVQLEMIGELKAASPPYIILDSEFDSIHEPNDSSISTGVSLLDDFIHSRYRYVQSFGEMSIWQLIADTNDHRMTSGLGMSRGDPTEVGGCSRPRLLKAKAEGHFVSKSAVLVATLLLQSEIHSRC
jgi:hypothetical protein